MWGEPPINGSLPSISLTAKDGQTLKAAKGKWGNLEPITYAYQWKRCDTSATTAYRPTPEDAGRTELAPSAAGSTFTLDDGKPISQWRLSV